MLEPASTQQVAQARWCAGSDARRDRALVRLGYRVLRLEADLVLKHPEQAAALIRAALALPP